ncbi:SUMF1/EgtB/PvdO family nonheme iron enzyme [Rhizobium sp. C4]|uniref:SUMF1/EgtB/PvdO family nonheme iron enzyme n=1 Tax=Rhizobium sp. C4 TaxID=1349800 RepID=UPI001E4B42C9|nr:SUMF1/EgtB/PvdO family nonheme iron enzyme [Rhizobium sp. C4]MCD2173579.1 SUMF1/EgtB/PvdO family nonheme iron enzyme [Rhizobium sp. C4]
MNTSLDSLRKALVEEALAYGAMPLMARPDGSPASLDESYIPLLVNFTAEDKAAKGLRKLKDRAEPEPPVYFSALEMVRDYPALLLIGETGSGKTTFARHLACRLARQADGPQAVARNEFGARQDEIWDAGRVIPLYLKVSKDQGFQGLIDAAAPGMTALLASRAWADSDWTLVIILDALENAGRDAPRLLAEAVHLQETYPRIRLTALAEQDATVGLVPPAPFARFSLLPLLKAQRVDAAQKIAGLDIQQTGVGLGKAAGNPAQFAMALGAAVDGNSPEEIVDAWLKKVAGDPQMSTFLCGLGHDGLTGALDDLEVLPVTRVRQLLAARHLVGEAPASVASSFRTNPPLWAPVIRSLAVRLAGTAALAALVESLIDGDGDAALRGALLASEFAVDDASRQRLAENLLRIVETGALTPSEREQAGRSLAAWGDQRDLEALAFVPGGTFTMGSDTHPNSAPPHEVTVEPFRIGLYPVTNGHYAEFVHATNRIWLGPDGLVPERRSAPATDLTWRDANAYCAWLTEQWKRDGRLADTEIVRLPTEPEWERAARGDQPDEGDVIIYPWGGEWLEDASNSEEAGFNNTCTVGLFPKGRSPYGCYDMTGQVWEWCTTLWGEDMATPSFLYPYRYDGREAQDALPAVRRVLRGGCFSSGQQKACCTYRGSLEPDGFWRGNGFRIVVSPSPDRRP